MNSDIKLPKFLYQEREANPVRRLIDRLEQTFTDHHISTAPTNGDDSVIVIDRFLQITGWSQGQRRVFEAMPHVDKVDTTPGLRAVLYRLGFHTTVEPLSADTLRDEYLPCFLRTPDGDLILLEKLDGKGGLVCFKPGNDERNSTPIDKLDGVLVFPESIARKAETTRTAEKWPLKILSVFRPVISRLFLLSFVTNLFALLTPLYVMTVYDKAIGAGAFDVLAGLSIGVVLIVTADFILRLIRGRLQAYFGARLDNIVNESAFRHLLHMPLTFTQDAPLGSQLTRLKQMTSIRDAFTGMLANAVFDLPYILLFLGAIALIGGSLAFAPLALIVGYLALAAWATPLTRRYVREAGDKRAQLTNLSVEAVTTQKVIYDLNAEDIWLTRHRRLSAENAFANMKARQLNFVVQTLSQALLTIAGVLTLAIGVSMVIEGTLTSGALIAVMALSWRVLNPIRNVLLSGLTLGQTLQSIDQIDRLLKLPLERDPNVSRSIARTFSGDITFDRISFRYPTQKEPSLRGVSFSVRPGQLLCICGQSGAGKSTILRVLLGLYQQQAGSIFVDKLDLRQIDPGEWRQSVGVALEESDFFFGTIAQNLRLAHPTATDQEIADIAERFGLDQFYGDALTDGIETRISHHRLVAWPDALKKRLSLCRAFIRPAPVYLLDNPADNLDDDGERALLSVIEERRPTSTIIMTTHRPSHIRLGDLALWLDNGAIREFGAPKDIIPQLLAA